jgi:hypothetical protein
MSYARQSRAPLDALRTYFNRPEARQAIMPHTKCNIAQ